MRKFLNLPWRVERSGGELLVVDGKNMIVCGFPTDAEERPGELEDEEAKAFAVAAAPEVFVKARAFLDALADPNTCFDEDALLKCANELEGALLEAEIKAPEPIPPPPERVKK